MAGTVGVEPTITGPEPVALPLGYVPLNRYAINLSNVTNVTPITNESGQGLRPIDVLGDSSELYLI